MLWWVTLLFYDSRPDNWASNPLQAFDEKPVADALLSVQSLLAIAALVGVVVALRQRWMRSSRTQRQVLVPVYAAAVVLAALLSLSLVADVTPVPNSVERAVDIAGLVSLMMVPFAFLGGLLRMRLTRAGAVSELVARLSEGPDRRRGLRDALADALGDPGLTLAYWLPARGEYVSASGHPMELPDPGSDRVATIVHDHGSPVAAILHDASLEDERDLIDAVGAAASITLENERLDAELRAKIEELSEQRRRGVVAALEERRRLERNLHDGAQQRLVSMALKLRLARGAPGRPRARGPDAGRCGRGAGLGARGAARAGPRHPPGRAERSRPRSGAGIAGRALAGPGGGWRPLRASGCPSPWSWPPTSWWPRR